MSSLQVLQNKAAKVILNRPLYSSSTEALAVLKWLPLEIRRFQRRCVHVYKCINGLINHDMDLIRQEHFIGIIHVTKAILDYHVSKEIGGSKEHNIMPFPILTPSVRRSKTQGM